jgi:hypothetical protein
MVAGRIDGVRATMKLQRRVRGFIWAPGIDLTPEPPGTATAVGFGANFEDQRSSTSNTLNFIIPGDEMVGTLRLTSQLWSPDSTEPVDDAALELTVTLQQTLRLAGIMVNYNGPDPTAISPTGGPPNLSLPAPNIADLQRTATRTLLADPISTATYRLAGA